MGLSLPYLAARLSAAGPVRIVDLNINIVGSLYSIIQEGTPVMVGLKVSSQNHCSAQELTADIKERFPKVTLVWGGRIPDT